MPTPVGPVPPNPDDPDLWDWSDDVWARSAGGDPSLAAQLARRRRRWRLVAVLAFLLLVVYVLATIV